MTVAAAAASPVLPLPAAPRMLHQFSATHSIYAVNRVNSFSSFPTLPARAMALLSKVVLSDCDDGGAQREFVAEGDKMTGISQRL